MPPSTKKEGKATGKTKTDDRAPTTKLEFGYPPDLTNALKAISDRATQDLWQGSAGLGGGEPTAEQLAQRHANMIHRLSKRIAGDVSAKEALKTALTQWTASLGHHLAAFGAAGASNLSEVGRRLERSLPRNADCCCHLRDFARENPTCTSSTGSDVVISSGARDLQNRRGPPCLWGSTTSFWPARFRVPLVWMVA